METSDFFTNLKEKGTKTEIAYWIGYRIAEMQHGERHRPTVRELLIASTVVRGTREGLLDALLLLNHANKEE